MTLNELKNKGKFTRIQLALFFGVTRQTISKWLNKEDIMPRWVKNHLTNIGE